MIQTIKPSLLYVEDDETLAFVTKDNLENKGYTIHHFTNGKSALSSFKAETYDLCILDVMLPEMDGFELAKSIRSTNGEIPILFLTAKSLKEDKLEGLKLGADDYITKPFSIDELILKIEIFLKRKHIYKPQDESSISIGIFSFNPRNQTLQSDSNQYQLTQKESDILLLFVKNKNLVLKRSDILRSIWGEDDYFIGRSLDVFISRLRKYLKEDSRIKIENIHGVGFKLKNF